MRVSSLWCNHGFWWLVNRTEEVSLRTGADWHIEQRCFCAGHQLKAPLKRWRSRVAAAAAAEATTVQRSLLRCWGIPAGWWRCGSRSSPRSGTLGCNRPESLTEHNRIGSWKTPVHPGPTCSPWCSCWPAGNPHHSAHIQHYDMTMARDMARRGGPGSLNVRLQGNGHVCKPLGQRDIPLAKQHPIRWRHSDMTIHWHTYMVIMLFDPSLESRLKKKPLNIYTVRNRFRHYGQNSSDSRPSAGTQFETWSETFQRPGP